MLLDEPTNYLDLERALARKFPEGYRGAVLVVSHDRYFLDVTVRKSTNLQWHAHALCGTYSQYEVRPFAGARGALRAWERQQEEIQHIEEFIRRFRTRIQAPQVQAASRCSKRSGPSKFPRA